MNGVCAVQIEGPVQVARRSDMDMNGHINNVTYLGWALETVPADVYLNYSLHEVGRPAHLIASPSLCTQPVIWAAFVMLSCLVLAMDQPMSAALSIR
jgi:hypothetical protein